MCQLNVYFVDKKIPSGKVLDLMKKAGFEIAQQTDCFMGDKAFEHCNAYTNAAMGCNCGSLISKLQDSKHKNFEELKTLAVNDEVERLEKMKELMTAKGYKKKLDAFEKQLELLRKKRESLTKTVRQYEQKLTDETMNRTDLSDEEKSRLMHETVYPKIHELILETEKRPEVAAINTEMQKFIQAHQILWDSSMYTLEKPDNAVDFKDFPAGGQTDENPVIIIPSNYIYHAIENAKKPAVLAQYEGEYGQIRSFAESILSQTDQIKILSFWQSGEDESVRPETAISYNNFSIDSLLTLRYLHPLKIIR